MAKPSFELLITCEHASNSVPKKYAPLFSGQEELLKSHRGWDPGAFDLAISLSEAFDAPLVTGEISRLIVELNRSLSHKKLFSSFIPDELKEELLNKYYRPYIKKVEDQMNGKKTVLHLSIHSFTPVYEKRIRKADVGILYDPKRKRERHFSTLWQQALKREFPQWVIGKNTPYRGTSDGLVTSLRPLYGERYLGIELEMNQKHTPFDPIPIIESLKQAFTQKF